MTIACYFVVSLFYGTCATINSIAKGEIGTTFPRVPHLEEVPTHNRMVDARWEAEKQPSETLGSIIRIIEIMDVKPLKVLSDKQDYNI